MQEPSFFRVGLAGARSRLRAGAALVPLLVGAPVQLARGAGPAAEAGMQIEGGAGELDAAQVEALLRARQPEVRKCYDEVAQRLWYVGGRVALKFKVGAGGVARSIAVTESTLGSYEIEHCMTSLFKKVTFPSPKGGDGELSYPVDFAAKSRVAEWPAAKVASVFADKKAQAQLKGCEPKKKPKPGEKVAPLSSVRATLYVGPGGHVTSVGVSAAEPISDAMASCLVKKIAALQFDDPLGQMTKVSYDFAEPSGE